MSSRPPAAVRALLRMPASLYRWRLGALLGTRFLVLTHRGRRTGHTHQTVLEVVLHDPGERESIVVAGWGLASDWFRNLEAGGGLRVQTGGLDYVPEHRVLAPSHPGSTDPRRRLGAQAHDLAARPLRSSFTELRLCSLRSSVPTHQPVHLDPNSLAANRWIQAQARSVAAAVGRLHPLEVRVAPAVLRWAGCAGPGSPTKPVELLGSLPMVAFRLRRPAL